MLKYSIIMPVFNSEKTLEKSILSVINQTYQNWEMIIIDDGSNDSSFEKLKEISKKEKRIKLFQQANGGPGSARNNGLTHCVGDYVLFIDADDIYESKYLEILNSKIEKENSDLIYIEMVKESEDSNKREYVKIENFDSYTKEDLLNLQLIGKVPWGPCSKVVKTKIAKESSFSNIDVGEELIYSFKILEKSKKISYINTPLYHYIYNDNGQHKKGGYNPWKNVVNNLKKILIENNEYKQYEKAVNTLAVKAASIAIYRCFNELKYKQATREIENIIKEYKLEYDFKNINYKHLDKKTKIILLCIDYKLYYLLYCASKFRKIVKNGGK